jgi:hypothetical protein
MDRPVNRPTLTAFIFIVIVGKEAMMDCRSWLQEKMMEKPCFAEEKLYV